MMRKLAVAVAITLARPQGVIFQAMFALLVFVFALAAHMRTLPYTDPTFDCQEAISIASFITSVWLGVLMSLDVVSQVGRQVMSVLIVLVNVGYLGFVARLLVGTVKTESLTVTENTTLEPAVAVNEATSEDVDMQVNPITLNDNRANKIFPTKKALLVL